MYRYLVATGNSPGSTSLSDFVSVGNHTSARISHPPAPQGSTLYALVRGINTAGLSSDAVSSGVVIGGNPELTVWDGFGKSDVDYQHSASYIAASWRYKKGCPLTVVYWAIRCIDEVVVQPFRRISHSALKAVNENVKLVKLSEYYVQVKIEDAVGLTTLARSNGVVIDSDPPFPSRVVDGPNTGVDVNYQASNTILQANWKQFGLSPYDTPGQQIEKYEVAVGTDVHNAVTRQNVVPFKTIGRNLSVTLKGLSLVAKTQRYFITVRAHSKTGLVAQSSSNGVFVGYGDPPRIGTVSAVSFINSSTNLTATWSNFQSVAPILYYEWAISTFPVNISSCSQDSTIFDVQKFVNIQLNTSATRKDLSLVHNGTYYVSVRCTNEALRCSVATSNPVIVDLTAPSTGNIIAGLDLGFDNFFALKSNELNSTWRDFIDEESDIQSYSIALFNYTSKFTDVGDATSYTFKELTLLPSRIYTVAIRATNRAGSSTTVLSKPVVFLNSTISGGDVKDGKNWKEDKLFSSSVSTFYGTFVISRSNTQTSCSSREYNFQTTSRMSSDWKVYSHNYLFNSDKYGHLSFKDTSDHVDSTRNGVRLRLARERGRRGVTSGAIYTIINSANDTGGLYAVKLKAAAGQMVLTSVVLWNGPCGSIGDFDSTGETWNPSDGSNQTNNGTFSPEEIAGINRNSQRIPTNAGAQNNTGAISGMGFHISGWNTSTSNTTSPSHSLMFWCRFSNDSLMKKSRWINLGFDPTQGYHSYRLDVRQTQVLFFTSPIVVDLFIDDKHKSSFVGVPKLSENATFAVLVRTVGDYVPPIDRDNPFNIPESSAFLASASLPPLLRQTCHYGILFKDRQAKISTLEACVSTRPSGECDLVPFQTKRRLCIPCPGNPFNKFFCSPSCNEVGDLEFTFEVEVGNLSVATEMAVNGTDIKPGKFMGPAVYYFVVRAVDVIGHSVTNVSNGIVIDVTPPVCGRVVQVDPSWSVTQNAPYQSTNSSIAAYWECNDNISGIAEYQWAISSNRDNDLPDKQPFVSVGMETNVQLNNLTLEQKHTYFVIVRIFNRAGLGSLWYGPGITVDVEPPDVTNASIKILWSTNLNGTTRANVTSNNRQLGIQWSGLADNDISLIGKRKEI